MTFNGISNSLPSPSLTPSQEIPVLKAKMAELRKALIQTKAVRGHYLNGFNQAQTYITACQLQADPLIRIMDVQFQAAKCEKMIFSADEQIKTIQDMQKIVEDRLKKISESRTIQPRATSQLKNSPFASSTNDLSSNVIPPSGSNLATSSSSKNEVCTAKDNQPEMNTIAVPMEVDTEVMDTAKLLLSLKNSASSTSSALKRKLPPANSSSETIKKAKYAHYSHPVIFEAFKGRTICVRNTKICRIMKAYNGVDYQVEQKGELVSVSNRRNFYLPKVGETVLIRQSHHELYYYYKAKVESVTDNHLSVTLKAKIDGSKTEQTLTYRSLARVLPFSEELENKMRKEEVEIPNVLGSGSPMQIVSYLIPKN